MDLQIAKIEQDIAIDKDLVTGKPKYTNETSRRTALKMLLKDDTELQESLAYIIASRDLIKIMEIELEAFKRTFRVLERLLIPEENVKVVSAQ